MIRNKTQHLTFQQLAKLIIFGRINRKILILLWLLPFRLLSISSALLPTKAELAHLRKIQLVLINNVVKF